jgi:hypothetical protein
MFEPQELFQRQSYRSIRKRVSSSEVSIDHSLRGFNAAARESLCSLMAKVVMHRKLWLAPISLPTNCLSEAIGLPAGVSKSLGCVTHQWFA